MHQEHVDVGILTVIPVELWAAKATLDLRERYKASDGTIYYTGEVRSRFSGTYRIALACVGEAGNPGAAAAATQFILTYRPRCILLMGIAAGLRGKVKIGQVVVSERIVAYERGVSGIGESGAPSFQPRPEIDRPPSPRIGPTTRPTAVACARSLNGPGESFPHPLVGVRPNSPSMLQTRSFNPPRRSQAAKNF